MRNGILLSIVILLLLIINSYSQTVDSVKVFEDKDGLYTLGVMFDSQINDSFKDVSLYKLSDTAGNLIKLTVPRNWRQENKALKFSALPLSYSQTYSFYFKGKFFTIDSSRFNDIKNAKTSYEDYESQKSLGWKWSATPKIIQNDSSRNSFGDLGIGINFSANFTKQFNLNFEGNLSSKKEDPNNTFRLNLAYRASLEPIIKDVLKIRPISLRIQENTIQTLQYHDISGSAIISFVVEPPKGFQHIYLVAAYDYAGITQQNKEPFREGRFNVELMWGFEGLIGRGTSFNIGWQYWNRVSTTEIYNSANKKERKFLRFELEIPIADDKSINVKYQDGDIAPTFISTTNVSLGLHIKLNELNLLDIK